MIDLHTHTTASDGSYSFGQLVEEAALVGLTAIAITDHDSVGSAKKITGDEPVETIPGVELSVYDNGLGYQDIHVLGLFIDPHDGKLSTELDRLGRQRENQKKATVDRLNELGYDITFEDVKRRAKGVVGRPHIAKALMDEYPEKFASMSDVFDKLLGRGKPAFVGRKSGFALAEAVKMIHDAEGLAILAHPFLYPYDARTLLSDFKGLGGNGMETHYDYVSNRPEDPVTKEKNEELIRKGRRLAEELGLLESGGSDFHGKKGQKLGSFGAPNELLEKLKKARS